MAITRGVLSIARRLRRDVGVEADDATRTITTTWVTAWDEQAAGWRQAASDLVAEAGRLEHWPRPTDIARLPAVMQALDRAETSLADLAKRAGDTAVEAANRAIDLDAEREVRVIAAQAPTGEQEALTRHLAARLVAEQDRGTIRSTVVSRIRTDAVNVIRRRAEGQIVSDLLPLSGEATDSMRRELIRGVDVGDNPRRAAQRMVASVEGRFNGGLTRAMVVARTEILDAYRATSAQIHQANSDIVPGWQWLATFDLRTCPSCLSMHGQQFPSTTPGPDDHQQGRCARLPVLTSWAELGITAPEPPDTMPNAEQWFTNLPEADQLRIMGSTRLELLRSGRVGWGDLSTVRQSGRWRPSRVPTPVRDLSRVASNRPPPASTPAAPAVRSVRRPGGDIEATVSRDIGDILAASSRRGGYGDHDLTELVARQPGWTDPAQVVTGEQLTTAVNQGWTPVWRGVGPDRWADRGAAQVAEQTRTGDWVMGHGLYGSGVYASGRRTTAEVFRGAELGTGHWDVDTKEWVGTFTGVPSGGLMRMAVDPDARIIDFAVLEQEWMDWLRTLPRDSRLFLSASTTPTWFAVVRGYDVVRVRAVLGIHDGSPYPPDMRARSEADQWIILNRSVLMIEEA